MRKLKLDLETLDVISFKTDAADAASGTVNGHAGGSVTVYPCRSIDYLCYTYACHPSMNTCAKLV